MKLATGPVLPRTCAAALLLVAACSPAAPAPTGPADHVVLVSLDTLRRDHTSLYGYERETTPFLDELAEEAVVYTRAYSTSSFTLTSHMSMLTGLYPSQHRVDREQALSEEVPLLAERLRERGYFCVAVFRGGWIEERFGYDRGFDVFLDERNAEDAGRAMWEAIGDRPADRPLFLFLHVFDAHCKSLWVDGATIYHPPAEYADRFRPGAAERMRERPAREIYEGELAPDPETAADIVALYDAAVCYLDDELRGWVSGWREAGLLDDALLVVTSDHGEALGHRDKWTGHGGLWEAGVRVPLVVRYPERLGAAARRGTRDDRLTSSVDLLPTVLDLLELEPESWLTGHSLLEEPRVDEVVIAELDDKRAVVGERFKVMRTTGGQLLGLWDLERDPAQAEGVPPGSPARRREATRLLERMAELEARMAVTPGTPLPAEPADAETRADLEAIGYAGD